MSLLRSVLRSADRVFIAALLFATAAYASTPVTCSSPINPKPAPTEYFVSLADSANHVAHVSVRLREGSGVRSLNMPVWNALYQVRDFAENIEKVTAQDSTGSPTAVRNTKTSEWEITAPAGCVVVAYDIHLATGGPFGSSLDADHGFFNWAMVLMYSPALRSEPVSIRLLDVPTTWELRDVHVLGGAPAGKVDEAVGIAKNYDELVDSPGRGRHLSAVFLPAGRSDLPRCRTWQSCRLRYGEDRRRP